MGASTIEGILSKSSENTAPTYLHIALPVPLRDVFTYRNLPDSGAKRGCRVRVKFGPRELVGVIVSGSNTAELAPEKIKPISALLDDEPLFPLELLHLCQWSAEYYCHALGEVISAALPSRFREGKEIEKSVAYRHTKEGLGLGEEALKRAPKQQYIHQYLLENNVLTKEAIATHNISKSALTALIEKELIEKAPHDIAEIATTEARKSSEDSAVKLLKEPPLPLNETQRQALESVRYHSYATYLLEGVTGSGKTEVYLQAIARVLQSGAQALVLIPEIGLSAQTITRLRARFNAEIAELHSDVSEGERARNWIQASTGEAKIVVGTRLASLCPFKNLGLIIVDEEHDRSYKQQDGFKYSARDISIYRAHTLKIPIILGSATPSLESYYNAQKNKYQHLELPNRAGNAQLPDLTLVDLKSKNIQAGLSDTALEAINKTLQQNEQVLVFVNRRGFAPALLCHQCGWFAECRSCDTRMTVHQRPYTLICHHCERRQPIPHTCPKCGHQEILTKGLGTEQVESYLQTHFVDIPVVRIDRDSTSAKQSLSKLLNAHKDQGACIYVGTQILAKGHHLDALTLAVILDADQGFMSPDFRMVEQLGQLLIQVAGRAGRADKKGNVIVQSHYPEHPLLQTLLKEPYARFTNALLEQRQAMQLPPLTFNALFRAESKRAENCVEFLHLIKNTASNIQQNNPIKIQIIGPLPSSLEKVNERYRFCLQFYCSNRKVMQDAIKQIIPVAEQHPLGKRTRWSLDIDNVVSS